MLEVTEKNIVMDVEFVKAATDEELITLREICRKVHQRCKEEEGRKMNRKLRNT